MRSILTRALMLAGLLWLVAGSAHAGDARIVTLAGEVEIGTGDPPRWRAAQQGEPLAPGSAIRVGPGARVELRLDAGTVRLNENSLLRLPPAAPGHEGTVVELEEGGSLFDVDPAANRDGFEVRTPEAVVMVKGTRFSVALDGSAAAVSVFRGVVAVRGALDGHDVLVRRGFTAFGGGHGPVELRFEQLSDPWPSWDAGKPLPIPKATAPSVAIERARAAALDQTRPEVVRRALQADGAAPAAPDRRMLRQKPSAQASTDPVSNPAGSETAMAVEDMIAEGLLNSGGAGVLGFVPLAIEHWKSGPNELRFYDQTSGALVASMPESDILSFLSTGDPTLIPMPVLTNIAASGMSLWEYVSLVKVVYLE